MILTKTATAVYVHSNTNYKENDVSDNLKGTIKFFDPRKGFGFIAIGEKDYFLHTKVVKRSGFTTSDIVSGQNVEFSIRRSSQKTEVCQLHTVDNKRGSGVAPNRRSNDQVQPDPDLPKMRLGDTSFGTIKFYSDEKKYGFLTVEDRADVFFHVSGVPGDLLSYLEAGTSFEFEIVKSKKDDRLVANILDLSEDRSASIAA